MDKQERQIIENIKESLLTDGAKTLIEDIEKHRKAYDTAKVLPIIDATTKSVLSTTTEELLKRQGYICALDWVLGIMEHYQNFDFSQAEDDEV